MKRMSLANWTAAIAFLTAVALREYFTWYRPSHADPTLNRVFGVLVNYNKTVYLTSGERLLLHFSYGALVLSVFGLIVVVSTERSRH
jgi:hypothetical protein